MGYEGDSLACALACASGAKGAFYDIGANVGLSSLLISSVLKKNSYAFEPTPEVAKFLDAVVRRHELPITVKPIALSDHAGEERFYLSIRSDASNSLNGNFRRGSPSIKVRVETLDAIVSEEPALIKIDAETAEPKVLAGAKDTIDRYRPMLILEILNPAIGEQITRFFQRRGYMMYQITPKRIWVSHQQVPGDFSSRHRNWLFAPQPLSPNFAMRVDAWRWRLHSPEPLMPNGWVHADAWRWRLSKWLRRARKVRPGLRQPGQP